MPYRQVRPPAYGMRVEAGPEVLKLQINDMAGRDAAHFAVMVAATRAGRWLRPVGNIADIPNEKVPTGTEDFALLMLDKVERVAPGALPQSISNSTGAAVYSTQTGASRLSKNGARTWVVLMVYLQAEGVGGYSGRPREVEPEPVPPDGHLDFGPALLAVAEAFGRFTIDELRTGIIEGAYPTEFDEGTGEDVTFAVASCLYPSGILDLMPDELEATPGPAESPLVALSGLLGKPEAPTLLLLAGDQVYIDATAGLLDPKVSADSLRVSYQRRDRGRGITAVGQRFDLRIETVLDDHELRENWAPNDLDDAALIARDGKAAYFVFQRGLPDDYAGPVWRPIEHRGLPFFLADVRTERAGRTAASWRTASIMSADQWRELTDWLGDRKWEDRPKFVLSSSALLPRHLSVAENSACGLLSDAWDGYPASLYAMLQFACERELKGLVFLSGDHHISSLVTATVSRIDGSKSCAFHSIHSSALYAPYPFANAVPEEFAAVDCFRFPHPVKGPYECVAETRFQELGDGFATIRCRLQAGGWRLDLDFHKAGGVKDGGSHHLSLAF